MEVVFDATFLIPLLDAQIQADVDADARLEHLVQSLDKTRYTILIPTPALSEVLIGAGDAAPQYLEILNRSRCFRILPFDQRAAVEAAAAHREAMDSGDKREGSEASWAKVKFDRQIVAIAKVAAARVIYSDDDDIARFAERDGLEVVTRAQLPQPPPETQGSLDFDSPDGR